ncbi:hypothetical protein K426_11675 [Sphingobium sp. TKS]|nr:hypothetical protein K426_11675 [Sphingobium sp. TKS]
MARRSAAVCRSGGCRGASEGLGHTASGARRVRQRDAYWRSSGAPADVVLMRLNEVVEMIPCSNRDHAPFKGQVYADAEAIAEVCCFVTRVGEVRRRASMGGEDYHGVLLVDPICAVIKSGFDR